LNIPQASVCFTECSKDSQEDENFEFFNNPMLLYFTKFLFVSDMTVLSLLAYPVHEKLLIFI